MKPRFIVGSRVRAASVGGACRWCGFIHDRDMRAIEGEPPGATTCWTCHVARHAADADPDRYQLIWLPEIRQDELAHLARALALGCRLLAGAGNNWAHDFDRLLAIAGAIQARSEPLGAALSDLAPGNSPFERCANLEPSVAKVLSRGIRVMPRGFPKQEIEGWLRGDGDVRRAILAEDGWFRAYGARFMPSETLAALASPLAGSPAVVRQAVLERIKMFLRNSGTDEKTCASFVSWTPVEVSKDIILGTLEAGGVTRDEREAWFSLLERGIAPVGKSHSLPPLTMAEPGAARGLEAERLEVQAGPSDPECVENFLKQLESDGKEDDTK